MHKLALAFSAVLLLLTLTAGAGSTGAVQVRTLDGSGNNRQHPAWGKAGTPYLRVAPANYADRIGRMVAGPSPRYISNRVFNDVGQNLLSEHGVSQWGWVWGQFVDHDIGLRDETPGESAPMAFDRSDPLESYTNDSTSSRSRGPRPRRAQALRHRGSRSTPSTASSTPRTSTA